MPPDPGYDPALLDPGPLSFQPAAPLNYQARIQQAFSRMGNPALQLNPPQPGGQPDGPLDSPPSRSWAEPPTPDQQPLGPAQPARRDLSTPVRWMSGRDLTGNFGATAHIRDSQGIEHRLYNPEEIERAGGYQPQPWNPNTGFVSGAGEPLGGLQEMVDELNRRNPYQLAYADRGGIRITRPVRRGSSPQEAQAALSAVEAAKEQNRGLTLSGMESSYRDALASGNTDLGRRMAQRMYAIGVQPQQMRDIANEVQEANKPLATPQLTQDQIMDLHERMSSTDPSQWPAIATEYSAAGHKELAGHILQAANSKIAEQRNAITGQKNEADQQEKQREFDANYGLKQEGLRQSYQRNAEAGARSDRAAKDREAAAAATQRQRGVTNRMAASRQQNQMDQQQRAAFNKRASGMVQQLTGYRKHVEALSVGGADGPTHEEQKHVADAAIDQVFGDNPQLHSAVMDAYAYYLGEGNQGIEGGREGGKRMIDPPTAAAMAIQSVIGRSVTPMTPAPQDLGPGRLPGEEHTPAKDVKSDSQLNFGDY